MLSTPKTKLVRKPLSKDYLDTIAYLQQEGYKSIQEYETVNPKDGLWFGITIVQVKDYDLAIRHTPDGISSINRIARFKTKTGVSPTFEDITLLLEYCETGKGIEAFSIYPNTPVDIAQLLRLGFVIKVKK